MTHSTPSRNPADDGTVTGAFAVILQKFLQGVDDMLPATVLSYNTASNRATVQPLISMVNTEDEIVPRAQIASVPVMQFGGGGFVLRFPLVKGDTGWIKANDRDISLFKKNYNRTTPNTQRLHKFSDGVFIPDTMLRNIAIAGEDAGNAVLQNAAGTVKISLWNTLIKIIAPAIGIGGTPNAHAILDLQSTTQAFIYPRMTTGQRNAIPSPVEGMAIWNLDAHGISTYNGSAWS